jgi:predicted deacylase
MIKRIEAERFQLESVAAGRKEQMYLTFSAEEVTKVEIPLHIIKGVDSGPVLLILAAVHGDEYEGVQTVIELGRMLSPEDIRGTLLMVPIANPFAYNAADRFTPEDGCNLAREFPGKRDGTLTQRLAWHLGSSLIEKADFLLDMHSGGTYYDVPELIGFYDNDREETGRRSKAAAEAFGMEVLWGHAEISPGRTVSHANAHGIPWLYTEASGGRRIKRNEQLRFRGGALRLMDHLGMLLRPGQWITDTKPLVQYRLTGNGNFDSSIITERDGFFIPSVTLLQKVKAGDSIGTIYNCMGEIQQAVQTLCDGIIVGLAGTPVVKPGSVIYTITQAINE